MHADGAPRTDRPIFSIFVGTRGISFKVPWYTVLRTYSVAFQYYSPNCMLLHGVDGSWGPSRLSREPPRPIGLPAGDYCGCTECAEADIGMLNRYDDYMEENMWPLVLNTADICYVNSDVASKLLVGAKV